MTVWLKIVHIAALAVWCGGLLAMPGLFASRGTITDPKLRERLQRLSRATFIRVTSPAAFIAIVSGTALIFTREVFDPWFSLKLAAVGLLVVLHVRIGYVLTHLYEFDRYFARWRQALATGATVGVIAAILWLVLAKPAIDFEALPEWLREPGALHSLLYNRRPTP